MFLHELGMLLYCEDIDMFGGYFFIDFVRKMLLYVLQLILSQVVIGLVTDFLSA